MDRNRLHIFTQGADMNPPLVFTNPFSYVPHPLCVAAAAEVKHYVEQHKDWEEELGRGKMFGVLVVESEDDSEKSGLAYLAAFSGQLNGESELDFFVPPIFDVNSSAYFQEEMHKIEELIDNQEERKSRSEDLQEWLFCQYRFFNAQGEEKSLMDIFKDFYKEKMLKREHYERNAQSHHIPSGSGECCAPKLLQYAFLHHLRPLCMAEFWYEKSKEGQTTYRNYSNPEVRHHGSYYPACQKKCRPILSFMLRGLDVEESRTERQSTQLINKVEVVYEDDKVVVVNKPSGLLSVPGRNGQKSVADWLKDVHRTDTFWFVHRLDQDTSGLLIIAKDETTYKSLQQQFIRHEVRKTYVALLDGLVKGDEGKIKLRMRPDPNDPPRQIIDEEHGKQSVTRWRVTERTEHQTRVELYPDTGRTHQLRVHCAHPKGLNAPIHGDRLYGKTSSTSGRLSLHAKKLEIKIGGKLMTFIASEHN